jgi:hypothetical protein
MHIITTTINKPTKATLKFCELASKNNWKFTIIGDLKTPHSLYEDLVKHYNSYVEYLDPKKQEDLYPKLSSILGWNTIQRRNIGFLYAYKSGAEIIATVDDDNIPYDNWGTNLLIGKEVEVDVYQNKHCSFFDPFSATNQKEFWHRGFPLEYLELKNCIDLTGTQKVKVLVQADFWDGDPDIDAICRLTKKPLIKFNKFQPFTTLGYAPFNTQNTFLHRSIFPHFSVWPNVGRMDDIWASYYLRTKYPSNIVYCPASVYQERNPQDLVKNLENECIGYRHTKEFVENGCNINLKFVPTETKQFIELYETLF